MSGVERAGEDRWAIAAAIAVLGSGIVTGSPLLVALAVMPLGFVAATGFDSSPEPTVSLDREFEAGDATGEDGLMGDPSERVTVRLVIHNTGAEPLVDLRVVDGVPDEVPVVAGTPRACVTLAPDEAAELEYEVELRRGEHSFGDALVRSRGAGATTQRTDSKPVSGDESLRCFPFVDDVPLDDGGNDYAGEIPTDEGGSGVEFYSVREYEPGDPVRSIDWRRYANTRDLATIEFRAERATRVVCVVDRRQSQTRGQSPDHLPALELSIAATERTFDAIVEAGYPTGIVCLNDRLQLRVEPGTDAATRQQGSNLLEAMRDRKWEVSEHASTHWGDPKSVIPSLLPGEAQVVLFSSVVDDPPVTLVEQLRVQGYSVCVVSPDVASGREDTAGRLTALERRNRLATIRQTGARVVDWDVGQPLGTVLNQVVTEVSSR